MLITMKEIPDFQSLQTTFPDIRLAVLFGSVAQSRATLDSDIDFAVKLCQPLTLLQRTAMIEEITLITGRPVDLIDLHTVGQPLLNQIVTTGIKVMGTEEEMAKLMLQNVIANADFVPLQERMLKERLDAWISN